MDDYNKKQNGELRGFDEVTNENGYTVTPDGGFYTKSREDIIQDEAFKSPEQPDDAAQAESGCVGRRATRNEKFLARCAGGALSAPGIKEKGQQGRN